MSIILAGETLNPNLYWSDRNTWAPVTQTAKRTIGGTPVIRTGVMSNARPITLVAFEDQGWLTLEQRNFLQLIANTAGGVYPLSIGSENFSVMFRHHEPPALDLLPLIQRSIAQSGDYFIGTIKLMSV